MSSSSHWRPLLSVSLRGSTRTTKQVQLLGIAVLWLTMPRRFTWGELILILVAIGATAAPPCMYAFVAVEYSTTLLLGGGALQNFVILQSMFAVIEQKPKTQ